MGILLQIMRRSPTGYPKICWAKGVQAAFDEVCPDCGFDLKDIMSCERVWLSRAGSTYVNTKHPKATLLLEEPLRTFEGIRPRSAHLPAEEQVLTTGIEKLDRLVQLATGQFVVFRGLSPPASLTELLCVRAQLNHPVGLNSGAIFIDGGNRFDVYAISHYAIKYRIEPKFALSRIHISRAFTYFQLASLLTEKLPDALKRCISKFAVVLGITELFQDPEVKDKQEAHRVFQRILHSLSAVVEITGSLVIATSFSQNIRYIVTAEEAAIKSNRAVHPELFEEEISYDVEAYVKLIIMAFVSLFLPLGYDASKVR